VENLSGVRLRGKESICLDDDDESTPCTKRAKLEEKSDAYEAKVKKVEYIADKLDHA